SVHIQLRKVARTYGDQMVFDGVELDIGPGARLALVGANGSGKSTLLLVMAGLDAPDAGTVLITVRVALLAQQEVAGTGTLLDAVTPPALSAAQREFEAASGALSGGTDEGLARFAEAEETYRLAGGYDFAARASAVLAGLGLDARADAARLSGGQARRALLARLLLSPADVYLLDEPTNHLDLDGAEWLETWIASSGAAFVLASHDRAFLDGVATETAELERGVLTAYPGGYSQAMELKATLREAQERDFGAYKRKRATLDEERARRASKARSAGQYNHKRSSDGDKMLAKGKAQNAQGVNASAARRLERQIERLDGQATSKPFDDRRLLRLELPSVPVGPAEVLRGSDLRVCRDERTVLDGVNLHVRRGEKIALTGPNGGGKSTLLGALLGTLPHAGEVRWGQGLTRYAAGQHGEELAGLGTLGDALLGANPHLTPHQLHEVAAQLQLPGPAFPLGSLSGGQRTRLSLARLSVTRAQVLVLDEPTNHLDIT
ncbi:ABC-F family ATP-binding cassette domain-containing protein, partial [Deinococcus sp.]|uniref:ABC-F family ATP-binding cassette domain-containing protein n=1 Tax=Deinococcus sp. TaxID=47478 RepID=UPI002869BD89